MPTWLFGAASPSEQLFAFLFLMVVVAVALISAALGGQATYDVSYKGGAPYCPRCNRQIRVRRGYCRSCGYTFVSYSPKPPNNPEPIGDPIIERLCGIAWRLFAVACLGIIFAVKWAATEICKSCYFVFTFSWVGRLPEWAQPIIWGMIASIPISLFLIIFHIYFK